MDIGYLLLESPMHINWNYTYKCNFNCNHCYSRNRSDIKELSPNEKLHVAKNIVESKVFNVNLGGGEPLLCDDCYETIKFMSDSGVNVNLSSNGWKISDKQIQMLSNSGLSGVFLSIDHIIPEIHDSNRNKVGSFDEVCNSIVKFVESKIQVFISTVITSANYDYIEDIICFGVNNGVTGIDLKRLKTTGNALNKVTLEITDNQKERLYTNIPIWKSKYPIRINLVYGTHRIPGIDAGCPCGKTSLAILSNGDISPCVYNTFCVGNALTDSIRDIWHSQQLNYMRNNFECLGLMKKK